MIKIENTDVYGFEPAIRGMRNPKNSWDKSDSIFLNVGKPGFHNILGEEIAYNDVVPKEGLVGPADLKLMTTLIKGGPEHRKFLRQISIWMDITAPIYWNAEFDTYKIGVTRDSCSFMHKGVSKPFTIDDFSIHNKDVYDALTPLVQKKYPLHYDYDTTEFKIYEVNGREYEIYRNGKVYARPFDVTDETGRIRHFEGHECHPEKSNPSGYYELNIGGRNGERWLLHRLIATIYIPNPKGCRTVNHINGDKGDNCVENLEWCALEDNISKGFIDGHYERISSMHSKYLRWKYGHHTDPLLKQAMRYDHRVNKLSIEEIVKKYDLDSKKTLYNILFIPPCEENETFEEAYVWEQILNMLNSLRLVYLETKNEAVFQQIRCLLPSGYNQTFTIIMNYENALNMIKQRSNHRLDEWREFCSILTTLPYMSNFIKKE